MRQITVRRVDDDVYKRLKERARRRDRSLEAEVRAILEAAARSDRGASVRWVKAFRARLAGRSFSDPVADIRADRDSR
jgi:plasmid stability protein